MQSQDRKSQDLAKAHLRQSQQQSRQTKLDSYLDYYHAST